MFLLDTDHCVFLLRRHAPICRRFESQRADQAFISIITAGELLFGAYWSKRREENLTETNHLLDSITMLPLTRSVMDRFGRVKAEPFGQGRPIQDPDILIACTAIEYDLTLVSHNREPYRRVVGLRLEDWSI